MKFKIEKNLKIINELISYCYHAGSQDVNINIKTEGPYTLFLLSCIVENLSEEKLFYLNRALNTQRQHEVEQYYWHLGGDSEIDEELTLIGMMIDEAVIEYSDNALIITAVRIEEEV